MFKKLFASIFILASTISFAKNTDTTLTVLPNNPDDWGYMAGSFIVNNGPINYIDAGITVPISVGDHIALTVYAMNARPRLAESCENIQIQSLGKHQLLFELSGDWLIHCKFS